jgi:hypothetical protein
MQSNESTLFGTIDDLVVSSLRRRWRQRGYLRPGFRLRQHIGLRSLWQWVDTFTHANTYPDAYSNTNPDAYPDADAHSDANTYANAGL